MSDAVGDVESGAAAPPKPAKLEDLEGGEEEEGMCGERTLWTRVWQGIAGASFVLNLVAMAIEASGIVIAAGVIALVIAPVVIYFQFQLQDTGTMRKAQNDLRHEVNRLQDQNNELNGSNTRLEGEVARLKEQEYKLHTITNEYGKSVDQFVGLVKENRETIDTMKAMVKADAVQLLVETILKSDMDASNSFTQKEINMLKFRLKHVDSVTVNEAALEKSMTESSRSLVGVLQMVKHMDDLPEDERIFTVSEVGAAK